MTNLTLDLWLFRNIILPSEELCPGICCFHPPVTSFPCGSRAPLEMFHVIAVHAEFGFEYHSRCVSVALSGRSLEPPGPKVR
jgi:hypothetical protein